MLGEYHPGFPLCELTMGYAGVVRVCLFVCFVVVCLLFVCLFV
jgi:hypothetical protein